MFEALGTKLLGRRVGRRRVGQTRVGQTRFLIWILEFEFGFWIFGVLILEGIWPHGWV